jgi:hypothetical protein
MPATRGCSCAARRGVAGWPRGPLPVLSSSTSCTACLIVTALPCGPAGSPTAVAIVVPFGLSPLLFGRSTSQRPSALPGYNRDATNVHDWDE